MHKQPHRQTDGYGNFMTEPAKLGKFSEKFLENHITYWLYFQFRF